MLISRWRIIEYVMYEFTIIFHISCVVDVVLSVVMYAARVFVKLV